jgi:hypothetical protein
MNVTLILAGLRLEKDEIDELRGRLQTMNILKESSYYQLRREEGMKEGMEKGIEKGLIKGARSLILHQGQSRFGPPTLGFARRWRRSRIWAR